MKYRFLLLVFMAAFMMEPFAFAQDHQKGRAWEEIFLQANQDYREGKFQEAVKGYEQLISNDHDGPRIQYNLGNAWFRMDELGRAILAYERARVAMPRDADLNFNLAHAQDQVVDAISPSRGFFSMAFFWLPMVGASELFWCFAVLNFLLWTALLIRLFHRSEWLFYTLLLVLCLWLLTGLSLGMKWAQVHNDQRAVILKKEVAVLAGPHEGDTILFKLHEGAIVEQERSEDGWRLIRLPDKKRGWLPEEALELITADVAHAKPQSRKE
ncbi:MAG: tetratricopeptide repeat protein [Deltaproteobacteria bacterium]|nr:tetratricopeptide repeat protein [Deltaproteobacteria bacterium]